MGARLGLSMCGVAIVGLAFAGACVRENPAFDEPFETQGPDPLETTTMSESSETPLDTGEEEGGLFCGLTGGMDMTIKVPQPCGETNDSLGTYEHYFHVVETVGSTWTVQFCTADCLDCEPLPGALEFAPIPLEAVAGPGTCLLMSGRRLGEGDDCSYHTVTVADASAGGQVLIIARRTELLDLPDLGTGTGLTGWEPKLVEAETCDCALTPDSCCGGAAPILYAYEVAGTVIPVGDTAPVTIGQRSYDFWAFDAFRPGECGAPTNVSWALVSN